MGKRIEEAIISYVAQYGINHNVENVWRTPSIKFADANHPGFSELKSILGVFHRLAEQMDNCSQAKGFGNVEQLRARYKARIAADSGLDFQLRIRRHFRHSSSTTRRKRRIHHCSNMKIKRSTLALL